MPWGCRGERPDGGATRGPADVSGSVVASRPSSLRIWLLAARPAGRMHAGVLVVADGHDDRLTGPSIDDGVDRLANQRLSADVDPCLIPSVHEVHRDGAPAGLLSHRFHRALVLRFIAGDGFRIGDPAFPVAGRHSIVHPERRLDQKVGFGHRRRRRLRILPGAAAPALEAQVDLQIALQMIHEVLLSVVHHPVRHLGAQRPDVLSHEEPFRRREMPVIQAGAIVVVGLVVA